MATFTFVILGSPSDKQKTMLEESIRELLTDFGFELGNDVRCLDSSTMSEEFYSSNFVAAYFGHDQQRDLELLVNLIDEELNVIPVAQSGSDFRSHIPECLHNILGYVLEDNENLKELALTMLESVGLLSKRRKIFISYVQNETSLVAQQLYNILIGLRYDVFLDSYKLHHGEKLTDVLSGHIIDSDIVIALDSPGYKFSDMAQYEYMLAKSRQISILHLIFPDTTKDAILDFNNFIQLSEIDFTHRKVGASEQFSFLTDEKVGEVVAVVQKLRCSSVVAQHKHLFGMITQNTGASIDISNGFGAKGSVAIQFEETLLYLFPRLGCPTSNTLHEVVLSVSNGIIPILIYNNNCFPKTLSNHLNWLNDQIGSIHVSSVRDMTKIPFKELELEQ